MLALAFQLSLTLLAAPLPAQADPDLDFTPANRKERVSIELSPGEPTTVRFDLTFTGPGRILTLPGIGHLAVDRSGALRIAATNRSGNRTQRALDPVEPPGELSLALLIDRSPFERLAIITEHGEFDQILGDGWPPLERLELGASDDQRAWVGPIRDLEVEHGPTSTERILAALEPDEPLDPRRPSFATEQDWRTARRQHLAVEGDELVWAPAQWRREDLEPGPRARTAHPMVMLPDGRVVVFSGEVRDTHLNFMETVPDTWVYDPAGPSWTRIAPDGAPPGRTHVPLAYDPISGSVILFHGWDNGGGRNGRPMDGWLLRLEEEAWARLPEDLHRPVPPSDHATLFHPGFGSLVSFRADATITLDRDAGVWGLTHPDRREDAGPRPFSGSRGFVLDPASGDVWFFSGSRANRSDPEAQNRVNSELVRWSFESGDFEVVETDPTPPPRSRPLIGFDPELRRILCFGGSVTHDLRQNDFWTFDLEDRRWREHRMADAPKGRGGFMAPMFDALRGELVMVHGRSSLRRFHEDVWRLRFDPEAEGRVEVALDRAAVPDAVAVEISLADLGEAECSARILEATEDTVRVELRASGVDEARPLRVRSIRLSPSTADETGEERLLLPLAG